MNNSGSNIEKPVLHHLMRGNSALIEKIRCNNQFILHNYSAQVETSRSCPLPGCGKSFDITLIPNQIIYPKYCAEHRTEHRRNIFSGCSPAI